jgi:recombination protein RecA
MIKSKKTETNTNEIDRFKSGSYEFFSKEANKVEGVKLTDAAKMEDPKPNSTGSFSLDFDLAIPIPDGRITEIYGDEGSGKTTLALEIVGQAVKRGKRALYVNMERNLNKSLLETIRSIKPFLGKEDSPIKVITAPNGETALELCRKWCVSNPHSILVLDSIDACIPSAILTGEIGDSHMGNHAKLISEGVRALNIAAEENGVAFICINQFRSKIGIMFGDPREPSGGKAIRYYATQRIELMKPGKAEMIKTVGIGNEDAGDIIGFTMRYKIIKNKCAPEGQRGEIPILFYNGIYREQEMIHLCIKFGLLTIGGPGGKQVLLPSKIDNGVESEPNPFSKFNAARRLLLDTKLSDHLTNKLSEFLSKCVTKNNQIENEIQDA